MVGNGPAVPVRAAASGSLSARGELFAIQVRICVHVLEAMCLRAHLLSHWPHTAQPNSFFFFFFFFSCFFLVVSSVISKCLPEEKLPPVLSYPLRISIFSYTLVQYFFTLLLAFQCLQLGIFKFFSEFTIWPQRKAAWITYFLITRSRYFLYPLFIFQKYVKIISLENSIFEFILMTTLRLFFSVLFTAI